MPMFKIKAFETVTYVFDVEADTIGEAIELVEGGMTHDCFEVDSSRAHATHYAIEGVMGWNKITEEVNHDPD